jgi:hypothetical protein
MCDASQLQDVLQGSKANISCLCEQIQPQAHNTLKMEDGDAEKSTDLQSVQEVNYYVQAIWTVQTSVIYNIAKINIKSL